METPNQKPGIIYKKYLIKPNISCHVHIFMITLYHNLKNDGWHVRLFSEILGLVETSKEIITPTLKIGEDIIKIKRFVIFQKDEEYYIIEFQDQVNPKKLSVRHFIKNEAIKIVLKCMYRDNLYQWDKIRPFLYFEKDPHIWQKHLGYLRSGPRNVPKLYFRGTSGFGNRKNVLKKLRILNPSQKKIGLNQYIEECRQHIMALSLPGVANTCHREIEMFGAGIPVLMPRQKTAFYDPLIPNYHYISVDVDAKQDATDTIVSKITKRFLETYKNEALLHDIRKNALEWYDRNILVGNRSKITLRLLGLNG